MEKVLSRDGTPIAFDRLGEGPPLVLVDGALCQRRMGPMPPLARLLAKDFTVFHYDRRGRGDSGDTAPFSVEREVEDLDAVARAAGGRASVYGVSSGAALALEAASRGLAIERLILYEPPFIVDAARPPVPADYVARLSEMLAGDRRSEAVGMFMKMVGAPAAMVFVMRFMPVWRKLKAVAHTLAYDAALMQADQQGQPLRAGRWASVTMPTLVGLGAKSPAWMANAMRELAGSLPNATLRVLPGQTHMVQAKVHASLVREFLGRGPAAVPVAERA